MDKNYTNIKERVLYFAKNQNVSIESFLDNIGMTYGSFKGKAKEGSLNSSAIEEIYTKYPHINLEWLLTGKGDMLKTSNIPEYLATEPAPAYNTPSESNVSIPLIPIDAMAGFGNGHTTQIMEYDTERYVIPEFSELNVEFLIRMKGSSMIPKYNSGDLLGCRRLPMDTFFQWNKVYVIDTVQGALVKRVHKSDKPGHIICVSDNANYPPFELNFDTDVNAIAIVLGVIRFE